MRSLLRVLPDKMVGMAIIFLFCWQLISCVPSVWDCISHDNSHLLRQQDSLDAPLSQFSSFTMSLWLGTFAVGD